MNSYGMSEYEAQEIAISATKRLQRAGKVPGGEDSLITANVVQAIVSEYHNSSAGVKFILGVLGKPWMSRGLADSVQSVER